VDGKVCVISDSPSGASTSPRFTPAGDEDDDEDDDEEERR
jgi:hypothetical protein